MNDYYAYDPSCEEMEGGIPSGPRQRRSAFVKAGRTFLEMQRPHFDADALIHKAAQHGIRRLRRAVDQRRNTFKLKEA